MFNAYDPVQPTVQHRKPGLSGRFTLVRNGSTLPNLLEPLCYRWNKAYRVISHEFGVVPSFGTCSNHCTTQGSWPVVEFHMSLGWFNPTEPPRITVLQREQGLWDNSNNCTTEGTRNIGQFRISLGRIYTSEPVRTNA